MGGSCWKTAGRERSWIWQKKSSSIRDLQYLGELMEENGLRFRFIQYVNRKFHDQI